MDAIGLLRRRAIVIRDGSLEYRSAAWIIYNLLLQLLDGAFASLTLLDTKLSAFKVAIVGELDILLLW